MSIIFKALKDQQLACRRTAKQVPCNVHKARVLTTLIGEIEGKTKGKNVELTDELCLQTIKKFVTNLEETMGHCVDADKFAVLNTEIETLKAHLPKQLGEEELRNIINDFIVKRQCGDMTTPVTMGEIMGHLKGDYNGQYDGKLASTIAREVL